VTLSLDLTNPRSLELFPLLFAYNHVSGEVAQAVHQGNMARVVVLQTPLNNLRQEVERRGLMGHFITLKALEARGGPGEQEAVVRHDERGLN